MEYFIGVRGSASAMPERAALLEDLGFDGLSAGDHRPSPANPHVWASLAAVALRTKRVTVVSTFANNLLRHPAEFAQASLSVAELAGGRFEAGIGAGWDAAEFAAVGTALPGPAERLARLEEACRIARPLLRGEACAFDGQFYKAHYDAFEVTNAPPLVAALGGPRSCRRIAPLVDRVEVMFGAAVASGSLDMAVWSQLTLDVLRERVEIVREVAPSVAIGVGVFVAVGDHAAVGHLADAAGTGLQASLVGEPSRVADALRSLEELGVDRIGMTPMTADTAELLGPALVRRR